MLLFSMRTSCTLITHLSYINARSKDLTTPPAVGYVLHQKQTYVPMCCIHTIQYFQHLINEYNMHKKRRYMLRY